VNKQQMDRFKKQLLEKREELVREVEDVRSRSAEDTEEEDKDYIDYAVSSYTKEFLLTLNDLERRQLEAVERAIEAVRIGTYGTCDECGEDIEEKRLKAIPWATYCLRCQELADRGLLRSRIGDDEE
jgi:DnaK suppressor protein